MILTNFKHYPSAVLSNADTLIQAHIEAQKQSTQKYAVAIGPLDIQSMVATYGDEIDIYAQHCDNATYGSSTGKILPEMLKEIGVTGVLLNHSEHRFTDFEELKQTIKKAKKSDLHVIVCAESADEGKKISEETDADIIAVEPPELIGGDISVSTAKPEIINESVEKIGKGKVFIGAGIKNGSDVQIAKKRGASGVLLASGVTKSENPLEVLIDLGKE